jgi:uncharacterized protein
VSIPIATSPTTAAPAPVDSDERLHSLDILRGLALGGMILVHFHQRLERPATGAEDLVGWGVWIFVEQKAWGTFAFLFGVGFAVFLRRLERRGANVVPIYARRLAGLALFGLAAQILLGFSILFEYACWGVVLLLVRRWPTRALLALALFAACARPLAAEATALWSWWTGAPLPSAGPNVWAATHDATRHLGYPALLAVRAKLFAATLPHGWRDLLPGSNLALFIAGLLAVRHRVLDEPLRHVRTIVSWMLFGAVAWALSWTVLRTMPVLPVAEGDWPLRVGFGVLQDQWLCFTYIGAVALWLAHRPGWLARLRPIGEAGRMALTNYLVQALVFDVLGSAYGANVTVRPYVYLLAAPAMFAAQIAGSHLWLYRYRFGPCEWLWRCLTYAAPQPLRREASLVAPIATAS